MNKFLFLLGLLTLSTFLFAPTFPPEDPKLTAARRKMVEQDLKGRDIRDGKVLEIMGKIPRHFFLEKSLWGQAYADHPLPIGEGQTISQPYIVAFMTQSLKIKPAQKVLEIGTGSGYQAAVLAELTDEVYSVEIRERLAKKASEKLTQLGYERVQVKYGDGYFGWEEHAPFDAIIVTAAANHIPPPLIKQLRDGGRLIIPLGSTTYFQTLTLLTKKDGKTDIQHLMSVSFVPMMGEVQKRGN